MLIMYLNPLILTIALPVLDFHRVLRTADIQSHRFAKEPFRWKRRKTIVIRILGFSRPVSLYLHHTRPNIDCRQLLYLDFFRFLGTMIVVLKEMLKESAVFFLLLLVIVAGFLQSFFGYVFSGIS